MRRRGATMYEDRRDAGRRLGEALAGRELHRPLVLALPRGGVPVAVEVARALHAELDVLVVRKIGAPGQPELGIGAVAEGGEPLLHPPSLRMLGVTERQLEATVAAERRELDRRVERYRGARPLPAVADRDVLVVDDGLATGGTARAALAALAPRRPRRLVLAVPVGSPRTVAELEHDADEVVCLQQPEHFQAVGQWYRDFAQTTDDVVVRLLAEHRDAGGRG